MSCACLEVHERIVKCILYRWYRQEDFKFYLSLMSHQFGALFAHSQRVAYYAILLAQQMLCNEFKVAYIGAAALMHDVGKLNIDTKILYKQGVYTAYEQAEMERHPVYGSQTLRRSKALAELAPAVGWHHERWDGGGYPSQMKEQDIPLSARIIHIAEAFDTMTSVQNYRAAISVDEAMKEICYQAGKQFDPQLANAFIRLAPEIAANLDKSDSKQIGLEAQASESCVQPMADSAAKLRYFTYIRNLGIICLDTDGKVVFCNSYAEQLRKLPPGSLVGKNFLDSYLEHRRAILSEKFQQMRQGEKNEWYRLMGRDGNFIENRYSRVIDENGNFIGTVLVTIDVTKREKIAHSLSSALERQAALYEAAQLITAKLSIAEIMEGILEIVRKVMLVDTAIIYLSHDKSMYPESIFYDLTVLKKCVYELKQECEQIVEHLSNTRKTYIVEEQETNMGKFYIPLVYRNMVVGVMLVQRLLEAPLDKERLELLETLGSQAAVAVRNAKLYEEVVYLAEYDKLTGLRNRHSFEKIFEEQCKASKSLSPLTVVMIDINELKKVNDQYGHMVGDWVIRSAAQAILSSIRSSDWAFRYGGDEIVVLMPGITSEQAQIIIKQIERNIKLWKNKKNQYPINLSISIGAVDSKEVDKDSLVAEADKRMYESKRLYYRKVKA